MTHDGRRTRGPLSGMLTCGNLCHSAPAALAEQTFGYQLKSYDLSSSQTDPEIIRVGQNETPACDAAGMRRTVEEEAISRAARCITAGVCDHTKTFVVLASTLLCQPPAIRHIELS